MGVSNSGKLCLRYEQPRIEKGGYNMKGATRKEFKKRLKGGVTMKN